jgi:hypothetical protein
MPTFSNHVKASVLSKTEGVEDQGKSGVRQRAKTDKTGTKHKDRAGGGIFLASGLRFSLRNMK